MAPDVTAPDVTAVVVNYGTAGLALAAVESLLAHPARLARVHLVDNASPGGEGLRLAAEIAARGWGGRVVLHAEAENHGFGRGNNLVISGLAEGAAAGGKVFLLNPDARLENAAVRVMAEFLDAHPRVGAVGARIETPDGAGAVPVTAAFRFPSLVSTFVEAVNFGPLARVFSGHAVALAPDLGTGRVDWVSGAAVMFRCEALAEVGAFDPAFFLYYEEVELMHRMARAGWQIWHLAEARVSHAEGAATGVKSGSARKRRPGYWYRSWRLYHQKVHGRGHALLAAGLWVLGAGMNQAISALRRREPAAPLRFYRDVWGGVIWPLVVGRDRG